MENSPRPDEEDGPAFLQPNPSVMTGQDSVSMAYYTQPNLAISQLGSDGQP